jgi:hypothetical protein
MEGFSFVNDSENWRGRDSGECHPIHICETDGGGKPADLSVCSGVLGVSWSQGQCFFLASRFFLYVTLLYGYVV